MNNQAAPPVRLAPAGPLRGEVAITTDAAGFVISCTPAALEMLGYSARGARARELPNMFIGNRPRLSELLAAAHGRPFEREARFRPNDRKALSVRFRVEPAESLPDGAVALRWTFEVRWPLTMRLPRGLDPRQLITLWRSEPLRCVFAPGGAEKRRLFVCATADEVVHEEPTPDVASALTRAAELRELAAHGSFAAGSRSQETARLGAAP
jgi:hypothetical protein